MASTETLRQTALKGGAYLVGRQVVSIALKAFGVLVITRLLGPAGYGSYVSAFSVYQYILMLGQAGVGVYLLRQEGDVADEAYGTAYTMLAFMTVVLMMALEFGRGSLASWISVEGFSQVAAVIVFALPFQLICVPATVRLERALNFRAIAFLEITGQVFFYLVGAPLVWLQFGPVSLAIALVAQQAVICIATFVLVKTYPKFDFDRGIAKAIFLYAASYSFSNWVWQLRMLVNPMIVGPALGAQAVGLVGMTAGLLDMISVIKTIVWRLSVAILARFQDDLAKLRVAVREGMELQALAIGAAMVGFAWVGPVLVPWFFGARWAPVMDIYPYVALGYFTNALFNMHSSVLSLLKRNFRVAIFHGVHVALFAGVAAIMVPKVGMVGYGYGEVAALVSYVVIHYFTARAVGSPNYMPVVVWWVGIAIGLFWRDLGWWAIAAPFVALALPPSPGRIRYYFDKIRGR